MSAIRRVGWRALSACLFLLLITSPSRAQSVYGSMTGTVTDSSGAVIPNASVQVKNEKTGSVNKTTSTSAGSYRFPELPLGSYDLTVTAPGFSTAQLSGVTVQIQSTTGQNVTLQAGGETTTVNVNADAPTLQTESSDMGGVISDKQITELPLALGGVGALRSPEAFVFLLPGATGPGTANSNNGIFFSRIAGGQTFGNEVLIDGVSQQRSENGSSFDEEAPSVEALQEFKVTTALPTAEYNRTTGGIENFVTKSGTNNFHGTAYDIFRNQDLDANTWFNNGYRAEFCTGANDTPSCRSTYATPIDRKNDYGGSFGGPVWIPKVYDGRDKLFFFFAWEQLAYHLGSSTVTTVPTPQELSGDFSNPAIFQTNKPVGTNPCDGSTVYQGQIFDPSTTRVVNGVPCRTAYPGNKIPGGFSPVSQAILNYFPKPTNDQVFNNFNFNSTIPITNTTYTVRIDAHLSDRNSIWGSYNTRDNNRISGTPILPDPIDPNTWKQDFETHFFRVGWDYSLTPHVLNHFIFGSNRSNSINFAQAALTGTNWFQKLGVANAVSNNFPVVTNGFTAQEGMPNNGDNIDNGLRLNESVAWEKGAHSFMFGLDLRYQQYSPINNNSPSINFGGGQTAADPTLSSQTGNGLASELLGLATNGSQNIIPHQSRWISWYWSGFAQDDWKVTKDLTLNLGINYSLDMPRHEANNFTSNFSRTAIDPEYGVPGALVFGTTCQHCNTAWADTWYKDVAPRVGFAYAPSNLQGKTVFRGGAGIFYGPLQYDDFGGAMNTGYKANPNFPSKNGFDPSFSIDSGYPAFAQPPNLDPGYYNGSYLPGSYIERRAGRPAAVYDWTAQVQQQLATDLIMTIGYIGNRAQNLQANVQNINNIPLQDIALGNKLTDQLQGNSDGVATPFPGYFNLWGNGVQVQQALRPFPQYDFIDSGCCLQNPGHSSFDAFTASLQRRFSQGLSLQVSYTWAKTLTDAESALPNTNPGGPQVQNPDNLHQEKSISVQDIPQTLVLSYTYDLPFGEGKPFLNHGFVGKYAVGGWEIGAVQRYQSGEPMAFCCASGIPGWQQAIRYDKVANTHVKSAVYRQGWKKLNPFNIANGTDPNVNSLFNGAVDNGAYAYTHGLATPAFIDHNLTSYRGTGAYKLGDTPRISQVRIPGYFNEDISIIKNTPIHQNIVFQLKFELLNALNRHAFSTPDGNPNDFLFGVPTGTITNPRNVQITGRISF